MENDPLLQPDDAEARRKKDEDRRAASQAAVRTVMLTGTFLALSTLYFGGVNAYLLMHARPRPFVLSFEQLGSEQLAGTYHARLEWKEMAGRNVVRPTILLDGLPMTEASHSSAGAHQDFSLTQTLTVQIDVPPLCTTGNHSGRLIFERAGGPDLLPPQLETPVAVEVTGGFWTSWFLLRDWLIFASVVGLVLYVSCICFFPPPTGSLAIYRYGSARRKAGLPMPASAWFLPWRRSSLPLSYIWKKAGFGGVSRVDGEIWFLERDLSPMLLIRRCRPPEQLTVCAHDCDDLSEAVGEDFSPCGPMDQMFRERVYKQGLYEEQCVLFSYRRGRRGL
jgi:hypothetical protein